ncbi:hypothetical protein ACHAXN_008530 [Cyclotella atomus]
MDSMEIEVTESDGIATTSLSCASFASNSLLSSSSSSTQSKQAAEARQALLALLAIEVAPPPVSTRRPKVMSEPITTSCQSANNVNNSTLHTNLPINNSDRTKMCSWYYEMSNFLKISPSTASRAMSYLDRFMACDSPHAATARVMRDEYQLVALTALFIAIKLFDRLNIMPCHVSYLSRGRYTSEEVIEMEIVILKSLEWRVTTATKLDYAELILDCILPKLTAVDEETMDGMRDLTSLQIQLSDFYSVYSNSMQSMVALAATINAYEVKKTKLMEHDRQNFRCTFRELLDRYDRDKVYKIMDKLCCLVDTSSDRSRNDLLNETTATAIAQVVHHRPSPKSTNNINATCEETSLETFDAALQTMEDINFDWLPQHFLCCGSIPMSDSVMEGNAVDTMKPKHRGSSASSSSLNMSPGSIGNSHNFDSHGSIKKSQKKESSGSKKSPTSIATMLFGKS